MTNEKKSVGLPPEAAVCTPKEPPSSLVERARTAIETNPANHPSAQAVAMVAGAAPVTPEHIAVVTTKYWRTDGVHLGVGFMDNPPQALRQKILSHMNAWGDGANIRFSEGSQSQSPEVRISRGQGGYWSYLGTDILTIAANAQTMNLEGFTMNTPDSEFYRVVRHETGHTLGCPHEHMRGELIALIDRTKAIEYFSRTQGWTEQQVVQQVLTPLDAATLRATAHADQDSIMCYQIPGSVTKSGAPILGGFDIDQMDRDFIRLIYPMPAAPGAAPMTAMPASQAMAHRPVTAAAAGAPRLHRHGDEDHHHHHHDHGDLVEVRIEPGIRVLLDRPVGHETLDRLAVLLG